jgi:hypothetical protein
LTWQAIDLDLDQDLPGACSGLNRRHHVTVEGHAITRLKAGDILRIAIANAGQATSAQNPHLHAALIFPRIDRRPRGVGQFDLNVSQVLSIC